MTRNNGVRDLQCTEGAAHSVLKLTLTAHMLLHLADNSELLKAGGSAVIFDYFQDTNLVRKGEHGSDRVTRIGGRQGGWLRCFGLGSLRGGWVHCSWPGKGANVMPATKARCRYLAWSRC